VRYWWRLAGVLRVNATFALVLAIAIGMISLRASDVKVVMNVFAIFS
jgi:hypothetical protein